MTDTKQTRQQPGKTQDGSKTASEQQKAGTKTQPAWHPCAQAQAPLATTTTTSWHPCAQAQAPLATTTTTAWHPCAQAQAPLATTTTTAWHPSAQAQAPMATTTTPVWQPYAQAQAPLAKTTATAWQSASPGLIGHDNSNNNNNQNNNNENNNTQNNNNDHNHNHNHNNHNHNRLAPSCSSPSHRHLASLGHHDPKQQLCLEPCPIAYMPDMADKTTVTNISAQHKLHGSTALTHHQCPPDGSLCFPNVAPSRSAAAHRHDPRGRG